MKLRSAVLIMAALVFYTTSTRAQQYTITETGDITSLGPNNGGAVSTNVPFSLTTTFNGLPSFTSPCSAVISGQCYIADTAFLTGGGTTTFSSSIYSTSFTNNASSGLSFYNTIGGQYIPLEMRITTENYDDLVFPPSAPGIVVDSILSSYPNGGQTIPDIFRTNVSAFVETSPPYPYQNGFGIFSNGYNNSTLFGNYVSIGGITNTLTINQTPAPQPPTIDVTATPGGPPSTSGGDTSILVTATPADNLTLQQAATDLGYPLGLDWVQTVTSLPSPSPFFQANNPCVIANPTNFKTVCTSLSAPPSYNDPPPSGYTNGKGADAYPFYYDPADLNPSTRS